MQPHTSVRIDITWNSTSKTWRLWGRRVNELGTPAALSFHETAESTVEIDRAALKGLMLVIKRELESKLF